MPKAKWGAGDNMLTADDITGAEQIEGRKRYSGPVPPGGTYRFVIQSLKQGTSNGGNNKVVITLLLDGSWQPNHKQYDGAPVWHHLALTKANAANVRNFLDSIGATAADLLNGSVVDENDYITKLGKVGDPAGLMVYANTKRKKTTPEYPDPALEVMFGGYLPVEDDSDGADDSEDGADDDNDGGEAPF